MKKFLALLISVAMVIGLVAVPAAAEGEVTFTVATVNDVNPGDTVDVPVTISGPEYMAHGLTLEVHYDPTYLTAKKIVSGDLMADSEDLSWMVVKDINTPGIAKLGIICPMEGISGNGVLCNVRFEVSADCNVNQPLSLSVNEFYNMPAGEMTGTPIPFIPVDGAINLVPGQTTPEPTAAPTEAPTPEPTAAPTEAPTPEPIPENAVFKFESRDDVMPGSTITLNFSVAGEYAAHILNAKLTYDADVLEVVGFEYGPVLLAHEDAFKTYDYETIPGTICIGAVMVNEPMTEQGVIASITFKVANDFDAPTKIKVVIDEFGYMPIDASNAIPMNFDTKDGTLTPGEAPQPEMVTFTMGSKYEVPGGSTITLPFTIEGDYAAHTMNVFLEYDPDVLTVVGVQKGEVLADAEDAVVIIDYTTVPGSIRIGVIMPDEALTAEGALVYVTFAVAEDFDAPTPIEVVVNEFAYLPVGQTVGEDILFTTVDGIVTPVGEPGPTEPTPTEPGPGPGPGPQPPVTGAASLIGLGIVAIATGAGVVIFRKKED